MNRFIALALSLLAVLVCAQFAPAHAQDSDDIQPPESGLQTELEPVSEDMDWRAEVGLTQAEPDEDMQLPAALLWILQNLVTIIFWLVAIVVLVLIVMVLVNFGGRGGFRAGADAIAGEREDIRLDGVAGVGDAPRLGLDEILALEDLDLALGALLRLVLETAIRLTGSVLRRSATAREILRRLPREFAHLAAVTVLVRESERVRYGGATMTRERFEDLVASVRPLLNAERTS